MQSRQIRSDPFQGISRAKFIIGLDFAVTLSSPAPSCVLFDITSEQFGRTEVANVEQTQKIVPFVTFEISFCQQVSNLVFGVDILDLNLGIQMDSVKQPIKSNSVGSGHKSHRWTPAFDYHLNHGFVVFKDVQ